jgi:uncharacterized membrane protein YdjX (TVP38/TMEM64 family)
MRRLRPVLLVLLVGAAIWGHQRLDLGRYLSLDAMRALVEAYHPYSPLVFIGMCVAGIFLHLPEIVLFALGGMLFERPYAFAYGWIASVVGTTSTFLLVRYFARDSFQRVLTTRFTGLRALDERLERHGFLTVLVLRLVLFFAPPLNWAIGATRVRVHHYVAGTALGVVPGIAATVFFADSIVNRGPDDPLLGAKTVVGALLVAALLVAVAIAGRRLLGKPTGTPSA